MKSLFIHYLLLAIAFSFVAGNQAHAVKSLDFTIHQEYVSTRALGMGNAFAAVADDHSALFYNPAALARREDGHLRMFLRGAIDAEYLNLIDDIESADGAATEDEEIDQYTDLIVKNYGNHYHSRVPTLGAMWVRPNWGIAIIPADLSIDIGVHQQVGPMLNVNAYLDTTFAYGYARDTRWLPKTHRLSVGAVLKAIHRVHVGEAISAVQLATDTEVFNTSNANEGMTLDVDIGFLYDPPVSGFLEYIKPSFALVVRNAIDHGFQWNFNLIDENSGQPPNLERRIDIGSKFDVPNFWVFDPKIAIDIRDMLHPNWSYMKGFHAGAELYWTMFNWWKGHWSVGINQGYWTAGFGARLAWFQLDLATYGEEVGTSETQKESRRYMLEMSLDF